MESQLDRTTQQHWLEVVARHDQLRDPGHRRSEPRRVAPIGTVRLAFEDAGCPLVHSGKVLNVSGAGVMVSARHEIPAGTMMMMQMVLDGEAYLLVGRVVHSTQTVGGFKVGIELEFAEHEA